MSKQLYISLKNVATIITKREYITKGDLRDDFLKGMSWNRIEQDHVLYGPAILNSALRIRV